MAKINVDFNSKTYSVDESSLSDAANNLRTHLSTAMSGSGATINLGGTTYNVDSAKLLTATNDFIAHLGTVAGSDYKVVVGGVEYGVDANKMGDAVAQIEAVLGGWHSDDEGGSYIPREIVWDGNTDGLVSIQVEEGVAYYKVSDVVLTDEQLRTAYLETSHYGVEQPLENFWEDGTVTEDFVVMPHILCVKKVCEFGGILLPETGIYFGVIFGSYAIKLRLTQGYDVGVN